MSGVELIAAALAAGTAAGITDTTSAAIRDAYGSLRGLVQRRMEGRATANALDLSSTDPVVWRDHIGQDLVFCGADRDHDVLAAAERLLAELGRSGADTGRCRVDASDAKGVMIGDHNTQTNTFF